MDKKIKQHLAKDPKIAAVMEVITLPELEANNDIYYELLNSIVSQQLSVKAAATIFDRFLNLFPLCEPTPERVTEMDTEILRGCGLSYQKVSYIKNIALYWIENKALTKDWLVLTDEEIIAELTPIKGVGKWTVQMILMFRLNRPDVFPVDDLVIRQSMIKMYNVTETGKDLLKKLHEIAEPWQPYRSIACRFVWRFKDMPLVK